MVVVAWGRRVMHLSMAKGLLMPVANDDMGEHLRPHAFARRSIHPFPSLTDPNLHHATRRVKQQVAS